MTRKPPSRPARRKRECAECAKLLKQYGALLKVKEHEAYRADQNLDAGTTWMNRSTDQAAMLTVLSHAIERANRVIDRLPGFREYARFIDLVFENAALKAELKDANISAENYVKSFEEYKREFEDLACRYADNQREHGKLLLVENGLREQLQYFKGIASNKIMEVEELKAKLTRKPWYRRSLREVLEGVK